MKKRKRFRHLTAQDRDRIHALYGYGHRQKDMAEVLGVSSGTISRELRRYGRRTWRYSSGHAQRDAEEKRSHSKRPGMKIEAQPMLKNFIIGELKKLRSPDEIAGRLRRVSAQPRIGTNAIYTWLYSDAGKSYCRYLCTRRTRRKRPSHLAKRVLIPDRIPLRDRPSAPFLVHAEGDLFVSPRISKACGALVTLNDSKLLVGFLVPNKTAAVIVPTMRRIAARVTADTYTFDNGIENINHRQFGVDAYFCDPGAPYQKPHIESSIGLIRRWFLPKGTDLSKVSDETFQSQLHLLNRKHRRSLGYRSAYEVALKQGIIRRIPRISLAKAVAFR